MRLLVVSHGDVRRSLRSLAGIAIMAVAFLLVQISLTNNINININNASYYYGSVPSAASGDVSSSGDIEKEHQPDNTNNNDGGGGDAKWICSKFPRGILAATTWRQLLHQSPQHPNLSASASSAMSASSVLLEALHHPRDVQNLHGNWTQELLMHLLTPHVLDYTLKGFPDWDVLRPILGKLSRRIRHLLSKNNADGDHGDGDGDDRDGKNRDGDAPFKIVVFGGSVVVGSGCGQSPLPGGELNFGSLQECAWPFRLEHALNHILDHVFGGVNGEGETSPSSSSSSQSQQPRRRWIEVHNAAAGGTSSQAAIPMLQYWLSPALHPSGADVIINGYSANDNLPSYLHGATNTTLDSYHLARIWQSSIQFVQAARFHKRDWNYDDDEDEKESVCQRRNEVLPMVLYASDYLGNQQTSIVGEGQLDQAIQWLTDFDPTLGYVSAAHAVKRWVWADTTETFFSAPWTDRRGRPSVNVHFGMAGHVTTTASLLYYFLKMVLEFCDDDDDYEYDYPSSSSGAYHHAHRDKQQMYYPEDFVQVEVPSTDWVVANKPSTMQPNLTEWQWRRPPESSSATTTKNVTNTASKNDCSGASVKKTKKKEAAYDSTTIKNPCAFAFLAAPLGTHHNQGALAGFLNPFTPHQDGWSVQNDFSQGGFQNKLGLVAGKPGATMTLAVDDNNAAATASSIRVITIQYLKSYGDLWKDSRVEFRAQIVAKNGHVLHEQVWELEGYHEQEVSISYFHHVELTKAVPLDGGSFRLQLSLVGGQTFKINALMLCSR